jgi:hypothetical protein
MFLLDSLLMAPGKAVFFLLQELAKKAQEEWLDDESVKIELQQIYALLESGAISETEFQTREYRLVERLQQIARAKLQEQWQGHGNPVELQGDSFEPPPALLEASCDPVPEAPSAPLSDTPEPPEGPPSAPPLADMFTALLAAERSPGSPRSPLLGMIESLLPSIASAASASPPPPGPDPGSAATPEPAFAASASLVPETAASWPGHDQRSPVYHAQPPAFQPASLAASLAGVGPVGYSGAAYQPAATAAFQPSPSWQPVQPPWAATAQQALSSGPAYPDVRIAGMDRQQASVPGSLTMNQVIDCAIRGLAALRMKVSSVTSVVRDESGWRVSAELVERKSVPDTSDLLGVYELRLDDAGNILRYERTRMRRRCDLGR